MLASTDIATLARDLQSESAAVAVPGADELLHAIAVRQGFDRTPDVVTKSEMDRLMASGGYIELHRGARTLPGITADEINEQFRTGTYYASTGDYGNGIYTSNWRSGAEPYSDGTPASMLRMALKPRARTIREADLHREHAAFLAANPGPETAVFSDPGRYAAARGYDAIVLGFTRIPGAEHHHIVLNRTAIVVEEAQLA